MLGDMTPQQLRWVPPSKKGCPSSFQFVHILYLHLSRRPNLHSWLPCHRPKRKDTKKELMEFPGGFEAFPWWECVVSGSKGVVGDWNIRYFFWSPSSMSKLASQLAGAKRWEMQMEIPPLPNLKGLPDSLPLVFSVKNSAVKRATKIH